MNDYISREEAISFAKHAYYKGLNVPEYLEEVPAADVVPVRHGRWINVCGDSESPRQCSECLQDFDYIDGICYLVSGQKLPNFCPSCGAKMDGGQDDGI